MEKRYGYISKLARDAGICQSFMSQILSGSRRPRFSVAKRLAALTGTVVDVWLEGTSKEIHAAIEAAENAKRQKINKLVEEQMENIVF